MNHDFGVLLYAIYEITEKIACLVLAALELFKVVCSYIYIWFLLVRMVPEICFDVYIQVENAVASLHSEFRYIDNVVAHNTSRVLKAYQNAHVGSHVSGTGNSIVFYILYKYGFFLVDGGNGNPVLVFVL